MNGGPNDSVHSDVTGSVKRHTPMPALLDLEDVAASERAAVWREGVKACFPGFSVRGPSAPAALGSISGSRFGAGQLWSIASPALLKVAYDPATLPGQSAQHLSVMLQLQGSTHTRQRDRAAHLRPLGLCLIDGSQPFELCVGSVASHIVVMQMPRQTVLAQHPFLETLTGELLESRDAGTVLLRTLLLSAAEQAPCLGEQQRAAALAAIIQLLGALPVAQPLRESGAQWRVRAALSWVDSHLTDPELTATGVAQAQAVSRRRLDQLMVRWTGRSLSAHIWLRRVEHAARDLTHPRLASRTVTQIAFAAGFEDVAHFTRVFKRRYGMTPTQWRPRGAEPLASVPAIQASPAGVSPCPVRR